jgi:hypothetical protein
VPEDQAATQLERDLALALHQPFNESTNRTETILNILRPTGLPDPELARAAQEAKDRYIEQVAETGAYSALLECYAGGCAVEIRHSREAHRAERQTLIDLMMEGLWDQPAIITSPLMRSDGHRTSLLLLMPAQGYH